MEVFRLGVVQLIQKVVSRWDEETNMGTNSRAQRTEGYNNPGEGGGV